MQIRLKVLALGAALVELRSGVREEGGNNRGARVMEYLRGAGINEAAPWCAAFQQFVTDRAAKLHGLVNPLDEVMLEAYCPSYAAWAEKNGCVTTKPEAGDLVLYNFGGKRWDHVGMFERPLQNGRFTAIEGNTNDAGSREGDVVARKTRRKDNVMFIAWDRGVMFNGEPNQEIVNELVRLDRL